MAIKKEKLKCLVCGSEDLETETNIRHHGVPYGYSVKAEQIVYVCDVCGARIEESDDNNFEIELAKSQRESLELILSFLKEEGYSMSSIERALELPARTISRWKSGNDPSASGLALLRIIRTYPWILDVAERQYLDPVANSILVKNALKIFNEIMNKEFSYNFSKGGAIKSSPKETNSTAGVSFFMNFFKDDQIDNEITCDDTPTLYERFSNETY